MEREKGREGEVEEGMEGEKDGEGEVEEGMERRREEGRGRR